MTDRPVDSSPSPGSGVPGQRIVAAMGTRACPSCDATVAMGVQVCPECGARLQPRAEQIRCRHCGQRSSSALVLCPSCGRELQPAPSRLWTWALPGLVVALFVVALTSWVSGRLASEAGQPTPEDIAITPVRMEAGLSPEMGLPAAGASLAPAAPAVSPAVPETQAPSPTAGPEEAPPPALQVTVAVTPTLSPTLPAPTTLTATPALTATATVTPTVVPTSTPTAQPSPTPTPSPSPTPSTGSTYTLQPGDTIVGIAARYGLTVESILEANGLTPEEATRLRPGQVLFLPGIPNPEQGDVQRYTVQPGDTLVGIAARFDVSLDLLRQTNGLTPEEATRLRPGQVLLIPAPGARSTPLPSPTPPRQYTVQPGDTLVGIARRFGVSTQQLMAANGLSASDARRLRPGQVLTIPRPDQVFPTPTPTAASNREETGASSPEPSRASYPLDPPQLLNPEPDINVECRGERYMRWAPVPDMGPEDEYVLHLGYVSGPEEGAGETPITWVLELSTGQRTDWRMDHTLCNLAPQEYGRRWRWFVQVLRDGTPSSPPSELREFTWR